MPTVLAIDLGGTNIKAGLVRDGALLLTDSIPSYAERGLRSQLPRLTDFLDGLLNRLCIPTHELVGIGISVPGLINATENRVLSIPKDKFEDAPTTDLTSWAKETFSLPIKLENDAHAAALGEWKLGAGRGCDDLAMVTLGTGIGTSIITRGKPLRGPHWQAGVLGGHQIVNPNGQLCICGARGCVESETNVARIVDLARNDDRFNGSLLASERTLDYAAIFRAAAQEDDLAIELRNRSLDYWSAAVVNLIHSYDVERIVLGGGIARSAETIIPHIQTFIDQNAWTPWGKVKVVQAQHMEHAALLGLYSLFTETIQYA